MDDGPERRSLTPEPRTVSGEMRRVTAASGLWGGRIQVFEEVGRGGMARVLRAIDTKLRRELALKVTLGSRQEMPREHLARFVEEAQITAQLEHPNVMPMHDLGVDPEGHAYFSMKLIRGQSLESISLDAINPIFELRNLLERLRGKCRTGVLCACLSSTENRDEGRRDRNEGVDRSHHSSLRYRWIRNDRLIAVLGDRGAQD